MSSANPYGQPPQLGAPPSRKNSGLVIGLIAAAVAIPMLLICMGVLVALLLPAVQAAREAARRVKCSNNLMQIAIAMHNYHETYKAFPPAYTTDLNGRPLHSWRTLLLPYIEQQALYSNIDLSKPWDDPVNLPMASIVVPTYTCPSLSTASPEMTTYQVVVDPSGIFTGPASCPISTIVDGTSNTLLVVEVDSANVVSWMSPQDTDLPTFLGRGRAGRSPHPRGRNVVLADGSVRFLSDTMDTVTARGVVSKAGGESTLEL
jgi:prepilin-type processing-associated H-X9-DG protein